MGESEDYQGRLREALWDALSEYGFADAQDYPRLLRLLTDAALHARDTRIAALEEEVAAERKRTAWHWHLIAQHQGERAETLTAELARERAQLTYLAHWACGHVSEGTGDEPDLCRMCDTQAELTRERERREQAERERDGYVGTINGWADTLRGQSPAQVMAKLDEAGEILTRWGNIDAADATARLIAAERDRDVARLQRDAAEGVMARLLSAFSGQHTTGVQHLTEQRAAVAAARAALTPAEGDARGH